MTDLLRSAAALVGLSQRVTQGRKDVLLEVIEIYS
jgi:hypothetical protein